MECNKRAKVFYDELRLQLTIQPASMRLYIILIERRINIVFINENDAISAVVCVKITRNLSNYTENIHKLEIEWKIQPPP